MSTLRISNIEAKANSSSPSIDEKLKFTNSVGDVLVYVDGKTSGITTIGINTTAESLKFDKNNNIYSTGIITATTFSGAFDGTTGSFSGDVSIGGTLTYEDVTNIDSVGLVTAREGIFIPDNKKVQLGNVAGTADFEIAHDTTNTVLQNRTGALYLKGIGGSGNNIIIEAKNNANSARFIPDGAVDLYYNNTKRISTSGIGVTVAGTIDLDAISTTISDTAVDLFVYDTRKDSDGGAWRKRTSHTSWYNETFGTKRGSKKEFPAVAVISVIGGTVSSYGADNGNMKIRIYDADDPTMPLWMEFEGFSNVENLLRGGTNYALNNVHALNGTMCFTRTGGYGMGLVSFIDEKIYSYWDASSRAPYRGSIADRNSAKGIRSESGYGLAHATTNDVAMTILPNAPIDANTGLPIPTIAVATNAGVSVIRDDGNIMSDTSIYGRPIVKRIKFKGERLVGLVHQSGNTGDGVMFIESFRNIPLLEGTDTRYPFFTSSDSALTLYSIQTKGTHQIEVASESVIAGGDDGLGIIEENANNPTSGMLAHIATNFNSGWQHGDSRGAYLSDTSTTDAAPTNLITNGDFASNTTGWTGSNATLSVVSNRMKILTTANNGYAYQAITTVVGKQYVLTFYISADGNASVWVRISTSAGGVDIVNANPIGEGKNAGFNFVATATTTYINFMISQSGTNKDIHIDNVKVTLAEADRSPSEDGLEVRGTVPKQVVATGSDLVSYGPFSTSNFLYQPINNSSYSQYSNLRDFGDGAMYYMTWIYCTSHSAVQVIAALWNGQNSSDKRTAWYINASDGNLSLYEQDGGSTSAQGTLPIALNVWNHCVTIRGADYLRAYVNGKEYTSNFTARNISQNDMALMVGGDRWDNGTSPASAATTSKLSLLRIGKGAPSSEQVRKMYEDEGKLFTPNAKCTLYGSSDAVTAVAYDDGNNTIHAGTSSGRSEFVGLNRINNTTTPVTASISASNGLVADE